MRAGAAGRGARDARGSARQHDSRLLRRPAARTAGRGARRSAVRRPHRAAGRPPVRTRVSRAGCRTRSASRRRACGGRCGARRRPRSAAATPTARSTGCATPGGPWPSGATSRRRGGARRSPATPKSIGSSPICTGSPSSRPPASRRDNLFVDTDGVRRLSRQIQLEESFGRRDYDGVGGAARRPGSRSRVLAHPQGQRLQVRQGRHPHRGARRRASSCSPSCSSSGRRRMPTWPRASSRNWRARRRATRS